MRTTRRQRRPALLQLVIPVAVLVAALVLPPIGLAASPPDLDAVRAGIRHHHERWDGSGYLDRLAGEAIPAIARVLAVADAFSAMTTTRPYRKALTVREALDRLGDAAGTQLEDRLVVAFIEGIVHDADPPMPGAPNRAESLWTPRRHVA